MGCLSSRSITVSPVDSSNSTLRNSKNSSQKKAAMSKDNLRNSNEGSTSVNNQQNDTFPNMNGDDGRKSNISKDGQEEDISIPSADPNEQGTNNDTNETNSLRKKMGNSKRNKTSRLGEAFNDGDGQPIESEQQELERENSYAGQVNDGSRMATGDENNIDQSKQQSNSNENSFDEELNMDLLKQYVAVDFEITQLEDKDALRIYHEKIEQLEQLERELDMISTEAEEVAARNELDESGLNNGAAQINNVKQEGENNSLISGITGSVSVRSSVRLKKQGQTARRSRGKNDSSRTTNLANSGEGISKSINKNDKNQFNDANQTSTRSFSIIEEVFNRKIILEKERDKLKKEVELVIIECDKLQQKYKKRDEILDKLFDGRAGNGLENHLEQQLNWLMEQKHYVDQVFYAWKRAETLTSQTCEQFASALELLKRLPKVQDEDQRNDLANSIAQLLIKSRQDMEQAQRYNPNVDAPFFTETETERFDKIIETISQTQSFTQTEYSHIATVIQFAYKRAVSIRLWLEQILQITIARDSFELAEEYKWIAIQLRKERITLINSKLQEAPYRSMAESIREKMLQRMQQQPQQIFSDNIKANGTTTSTNGVKAGEINRDSGVESDDIDIEEEIYRLLEMNKSRLEASLTKQDNTLSTRMSMSAGDGPRGNDIQSENFYNQPKRDDIMRERIQRRVRGEQSYTIEGRGLVSSDMPMGNDSTGAQSQSASTTVTSTPSRLRVELDEATRQNLLKQVDQIHAKHRSKMESLRGNNKAKANDFISNKMQRARNQANAENK